MHLVWPLLLMSCTPSAVEAPPPLPSHGPVIAEATDTSAVLWARAPAEGSITFALEPAVSGGPWTVAADPARDLTASQAIRGLSPATRYTVRATFNPTKGHSSQPVQASFRTAPAPEAVSPVRFAMSGDLGGQGRCRRLGPDGAELGYPIFSAIAALKPDFFVMNGDQIYADNACKPEGPGGDEQSWKNLPGPLRGVGDQDVSWEDAAALRQIYWEHWRYNRGDLHYQSMLSGTVLYSQWDDHEIINDHGMAWDAWRPSSARPGYRTLVEEGVAAFHAYNPVTTAGPADRGIYRSVRWGADLELFFVDARSFRSLNAAPDSPEQSKTLLGETQRTWLIDALKRSDASFKVLSVDVPLAEPTGSEAGEYGHDAWADGASDQTPDEGAEATGFERELRGLLTELDQAHVQNLVFITTDVHFAQIARFSVDLDGDGQPLVFHEVIAGPLSAWTSAVLPADPSFSPDVLYAEGGLFNFAWFTVERREGVPTLVAQIRGEDGAVRPGGELVWSAR